MAKIISDSVAKIYNNIDIKVLSEIFSILYRKMGQPAGTFVPETNTIDYGKDRKH